MGFGRQAAIFALAAGAAALAAALAGLALPAITASAALGGAMGTIAVVDWRSLTVPDPLVVMALACGMIWSLFEAGDGHWGQAIALAAMRVALFGGALLLIREGFYRLRGIEGLGMGDVKLAAAAGAWLDPSGFAFAVAAASIGGLCFAGLSALSGSGFTARTRIAFASFLAPAIWLAWLVARI